ncbi:class I SAM-dependent methyltransferase [Synechococcus sp. PCC 7336]|uniref:class I SAM-dependent methyltransferase n=1 Tax=Synechococcus sp. PCC 7336 TaxID=195250 RepID=UPI000372BA71|nr:methyltransferase domain-containing protein [Synechococcus sp. PCC 7336]
MATPLRYLSYRYPWLYQAIAKTTALSVGGHRRFHLLPLDGLAIEKGDRILDLCCGRGEATEILLEYSDRVTGLDASPKAIAYAQTHIPQAQYVEGFAQDLPFESETFEWVHTSVALHEMSAEVLRAILAEAHRVLVPGGTFATIDFHRPRNPVVWPGLAAFLWIFETETAWQLLREDLPHLLREAGFSQVTQKLYAGGSLQVLQAVKSAS